MYDIIVLGGGPAGYLAAERAGHAGLKTLLIEKRALGGVCLNEGCVPSKALLNSAKILDYAKHGDKYGVTTTGAAIDQKAVIARKNKVVKTLVAGIKAQLKANHVTVVNGLGEIVGREGNVITVAVGGEKYQSSKLLLCTGSEAIVPPIPGAKEGLEVRGLAKTYAGGVPALQSVDLRVPPGLYGLLGPNGAGKSTLMRTLATLQRPDAGSIHLDGVDVLADPHHLRQRLGYLPQQIGAYPGVSARSLLERFAWLKGRTNARARRAEVDALLDQVNQC